VISPIKIAVDYIIDFERYFHLFDQPNDQENLISAYVAFKIQFIFMILTDINNAKREYNVSYLNHITVTAFHHNQIETITTDIITTHIFH